ncbi:MAG: hypothetical protein COB04_05375 [Gammaproteobacteria bacterium]|nr:MAG: hypothetical protein COB04_05375 [Gammaproteobacteria bacterium]
MVALRINIFSVDGIKVYGENMLRTSLKYAIPVAVISFLYVQIYHSIRSTDDFENSISSEYFIFHSDGHTDTIADFSKVSNALVVHLKAWVPSFDLLSPMDVYVLENAEEMHLFLLSYVGGGIDSRFGVYIPEKNALVTHAKAGLGTLTHILMYPIIGNKLKDGPYWIETGISTLFEKIYGYPRDSGFEISYGYHNPWRLRELGNVLDISLPEIVAAKDSVTVSQSKKRLAIMFIYQSGLFNQYLDLIMTKSKGSYETYIEAAFEKEMLSLETDWLKYLKGIEEHRSELLNIPSSKVFKTEAEFLSEIQPYRAI